MLYNRLYNCILYIYNLFVVLNQLFIRERGTITLRELSGADGLKNNL